ncbi:MAG TPA: SMP-30/gluconolactonase/LRE family protein [Candidatus Cybelea sp.]|nr:SMP-30/gluconolactonase/LRE family protein [Candidatus Cybelea sp.]
MPTRPHRFALAAAFVTAACSGRSGVVIPPAPPPQVTSSSALYVANRWGDSILVYEPGSDRPSRKISRDIASPVALAQDRFGNLFVANSPLHKPGWVSVYPPGTTQPARKITGSIKLLSFMALGPRGNVFVTNFRGKAVYEYAAGGTSVARTITQGVIWPAGISVDAAGYLYVSSCVRCVDPFSDNTVTIYAPKSTLPLRTIRTSYHQPGEIDFDANGKAYIDVDRDVNVYAKHSAKRLRTLGGAAGTMRFDAAGNLYSAQQKYDGSGGRVLIFAAGAMKPSYAITKGIYSPGALTIDAADSDLYVANSSHNDIAVYAPGRREPSRTIAVATGLEDPQAIAFDRDGNLYAANTYESTVTVYAPGSSKAERTIVKGVVNPSALAFDSTGNLYVANVYGNEGGGEVGGAISVYAPGISKPFLSLVALRGAKYSLGFDRAQDLYVASGCPYQNEPIAVYAHTSPSVLRTIAHGVSFPCAIALDASDNLYVANLGSNNVLVYPPGASVPSRTIVRGIDDPEGLAIDRSGNLFVTNARGAGAGKRWGSVTVYPPGRDAPSRTITRGFTGGDGPSNPVIGPSGELCVVDWPKIVIYPHGGSVPIVTIDRGLHAPTSPIFDRNGNLYVANQNGSTIVEYAAGTNNIVRTIPAVKAYPDALIFAPNGT